MQLKGKLVKWNDAKAFGFILPNGGGKHVFIHKRGFTNKKRKPQLNDIVTFSVSKDKQGRYCACEALFTGEKAKPKTNRKLNLFSIYLSLAFFVFLSIAFILGQIPQNILLLYVATSLLSFSVYALDKSRAEQGNWRIKESTLHFIALVGGWPGAALAQQALRHKSSKKRFRVFFWLTVMTNSCVFYWYFFAPNDFFTRFIHNSLLI